jgi:hypothetical protein
MTRSLLYCLFCSFVYLVNAATLLDLVRTDPQLSTFASFIAGTGAGLPNPGISTSSAFEKYQLIHTTDIEERFGQIKNGRDFTLFAPTNEVCIRIARWMSNS